MLTGRECPPRSQQHAAVDQRQREERMFDLDEREVLALVTHSHSIVAGGFELMSYTTRLMPRTSFVMREEIARQHVVRNAEPVGRHPVDAATARTATVYS